MIAYDARPVNSLGSVWVELKIDGKRITWLRLTEQQWERLQVLAPRECRTRDVAARRG